MPALLAVLGRNNVYVILKANGRKKVLAPQTSIKPAMQMCTKEDIRKKERVEA